MSKNITITNLRSNLSEVYNSVKYTGDPIYITNHGDTDVIMMRVSDVYPNPTDQELAMMAARSGSYAEYGTDQVEYE